MQAPGDRLQSRERQYSRSRLKRYRHHAGRHVCVALELLFVPDRETAGQEFDHDRNITAVCVPTGQAAHRPACQHVGLPVRLILDSRCAHIERQEKQGIGGRVLAAVFEHVRRDERGGDRCLSARKTVIRAALKPQTGIVRGVGTRSGEDVLAGRRGDTGDDLGIDTLPRGLAEARIGAFPNGATDLADRQSADKSTVDIRIPDARRVVTHEMVDARPSAILTRRGQRHQRNSEQQSDMSNRAHFSGRPGTIFPEALVWIVDCHLCAHIRITYHNAL